MVSPLPSVDVLVREAACDAPHALCVREARATLAERRARGEHATASALAPELRRRVRAALEPSLRPVLNATGVVLHTNLGRAPLAGGRAGPGAGGRQRLFEPGARPGHRRARLAAGPRRRARVRADRRRGRDLREQRRSGTRAGARGAGRRARDRGLARAAGRDRRRVPASPRSCRAPARGCARSARPTAPGAADYRRAIGERDGRAAVRAPVELPRRRLHREASRLRDLAEIAHAASSR